jgi:hypothetical protein
MEHFIIIFFTVVFWAADVFMTLNKKQMKRRFNFSTTEDVR